MTDREMLELAALAAGIVIAHWDSDSDPRFPGRSGMGVHTDSLTGCQYLSNPSGGLTPRLRDGKQICNEQE